MEDTQFEPCWAIMELFGHQKLAGKISEATIGGGAFVRIDVPQTGERPAFTRFYGSAAIYSFTPVSEEVARLALGQMQPEPVTIWIPELHKQIEPPARFIEQDESDEEDYDEVPF